MGRLVVESTSLPASEATRLGSTLGSDFLQAKYIGPNSPPSFPPLPHSWLTFSKTSLRPMFTWPFENESLFPLAHVLSMLDRRLLPTSRFFWLL